MKIEYYNCFSYNQMKFLVANGQEVINTMIHSKSRNPFWIFERSDELHGLLKEFSSRRNKN